MNTTIKKIVYYGNRFLNQPATIVVFLLGLFIYFAAGNAGFQQQNRDILDDTHATVEQTKLITQDTKSIIKNLEIAVKDLKEDNARQTLVIQCLLVVHGEEQFVTEDATQACAKIQTSAQSTTPPTQTNTNTSIPPTPPTQSNDNTNNGNQNSPGLVEQFIRRPIESLLKELNRVF